MTVLGNDFMNFNFQSNNVSNNDYSDEENEQEEEGENQEFEVDGEEEEEVDEIFNKKKDKFILELDEFQYKHLLKYSAIKEDKCPICLQKYIGTDIIKEFPCKHIFHKKCILRWTKTSNCCPMCKYDIANDVNKIELNENEDDE